VSDRPDRHVSIREVLSITVMLFEPRLECTPYDPDILPWDEVAILDEILQHVKKYLAPLQALSDAEFMLAFFLILCLNLFDKFLIQLSL